MTRREFLKLSAAGLAARGELRTSTLRAAEIPAPVRLASIGGVLRVELTAREDWVALAGRQARLYAFNGLVPGPILEVEPGDDVQVRLSNDLRESTNLHFHGLHIPPEGAADNIFLAVPPRESFDYAFRLPPNHPAGLFWMHPHVHGRAASQVSLGLALTLIVRGELDRIPEVASAREHILVLQDFELDGSGRPVAPAMAASMLGREGSLITVSGERNPQYAIAQDGMLRLRIVNASASRFYRIAIESHALHLIATDGGALAAPQGVDELLLTPGERRDVLVQGTRASGSYRLLNLPYDRGAGMMGSGGSGTTVALATMTYQGRSEQSRSLPRSLISVPTLPSPSVRRTFELGNAMGMMANGGMGMTFAINGREFDMARIDTRVRLRAVEEWEFINPTTMDHPMHIHTNAFQMVGGDGVPERAWRDVALVKARSRARVRIQFDDFAGRTVQHCHILDHEDQGMMATLLIER